jgi:23S rRNA (uracil1939-C5)-methyltransferase
MTYGGYGVAQHNQHTVYVPYAIEGERITARLLPPLKGTHYAEGAAFISISRDRVRPQCGHFGDCWGCQWQHIAYDAQLLIKFDVVAQQLQKHGRMSDELLGAALQPVIAAPQAWGYNYHATFVPLPDGRLALPRRDDTPTPIELCHTIHSDLQALAEALVLDFNGLKHLSLHRGSDGATMTVLHMASEDLPELEADLPTSVNVLLPDREPLNLFGESLVRYEVAGRWLRATAGAFFRPHVAMLPALAQEVLFALDLRGSEHVLDLYAGVGLFSAFMAPHAEVVTLVESYPPAATDAEENLKEYDNVDIVEGSVGEILENMIDSGADYQAAVVDPPARGIAAEDMALLTRLAPPTIVYVSSNPVSFARDALALAQAGYSLARVQPLDMSPQTSYADLVARFVR